MSDPHAAPPPASPLPPPPPRDPSRKKRLLRIGLMGCGVVLLLGLAAAATGVVWWKRRGPQLQARAAVAAREGARWGLRNDEAACFRDAARRANGHRTVEGGFAVGAFTRACLEYSRPTPGFCDDVPPPTAVRRTVQWQEQRCFSDAGCRNVGQVVQGYCADGRPKRAAADTLLMARE